MERDRTFQVDNVFAVALLQYIDPTIANDKEDISQRDFEKLLNYHYGPDKELSIDEYNQKYSSTLIGKYDLDSFLKEINERSLIRAAILANRFAKTEDYSDFPPYDLFIYTLQEIVIQTREAIVDGKNFNDPYVSVSNTLRTSLKNEFLNVPRKNTPFGRNETMELRDDELEEYFKQIMNKTGIYEDDTVFESLREVLLTHSKETAKKYFLILAKRALQNRPYEEIAIELGFKSSKVVTTTVYAFLEKVRIRSKQK